MVGSDTTITQAEDIIFELDLSNPQRLVMTVTAPQFNLDAVPMVMDRHRSVLYGDDSVTVDGVKVGLTAPDGTRWAFGDDTSPDGRSVYLFLEGKLNGRLTRAVIPGSDPMATIIARTLSIFSVERQ